MMKICDAGGLKQEGMEEAEVSSFEFWQPKLPLPWRFGVAALKVF